MPLFGRHRRRRSLSHAGRSFVDLLDGRQKVVTEVFQEPFQSKMGAAAELGRLGAGVDWRDENIPWHSGAEVFQFLYILCWFQYPVVKGTYMIPLDATTAKHVLASTDKLPTRKSSHLTSSNGFFSYKEARSAAPLKFIEGYSELLVQYEPDLHPLHESEAHLFLKMEGAPLTGGIGEKVSHFAAWIAKNLTGEGLERNKTLHRLGGGKTGVASRAAENYSKDYGKLLKALGLDGRRVTVDDMMQELVPVTIAELDTFGERLRLADQKVFEKAERKGQLAAIQQFQYGAYKQADERYQLTSYNQEYAFRLKAEAEFETSSVNTGNPVTDAVIRYNANQGIDGLVRLGEVLRFWCSVADRHDISRPHPAMKAFVNAAPDVMRMLGAANGGHRIFHERYTSLEELGEVHGELKEALRG